MKRLVPLLLALCCAASVQAQEDNTRALDPHAERARIASERAAAEKRFDEASKACRAKFAVTDCVNAATRERNEALGELKRQERVLKQDERRQRAAAHQQELDERNSPEAQEKAARHRRRAVEEQKQRQAEFEAKAAKKAAADAGKAARGPHVKGAPSGPPGPQGTPRAPGLAKSHVLTPDQVAKNRAAYEARVQQAEAHRAEVQNRIARRSKPAASGLPTPP